MGIISEEEYMATVWLKLIEVFLKKKNDIILDSLVYKWIKYLSDDNEKEYNLWEYFEKEIRIQEMEESKNSKDIPGIF